MAASAATVELTRSHVAEYALPDRPVPLLSGARLDPRIGSLAEKCGEFLGLPENWNSYRSKPIDPTLIEEGLRVLAMVLGPTTRAPDLVPTAWGGVQLEWHDPDRDLEIEIRAPGRYRLYHRVGDQDDEFDVLDDMGELLPLVRAFKR